MLEERLKPFKEKLQEEMDYYIKWETLILQVATINKEKKLNFEH